MKKTLEIEIRGKISKNDFDIVFALLNKDGKLKDNYKRVSIDLSPGFDAKSRSWKSDDQIDLRVKKSGEEEKISLKIGKVHAKKRQEIEIHLKEGEFLNSILLLETLGFNKGMIYFWESWEYDYRGFEIKLSKYTNEYHTWEIESKDTSDPNKIAKELKLRPYTKNEYQSAIDWENKEIHKIYSFKQATKIFNTSFNNSIK